MTLPHVQLHDNDTLKTVYDDPELSEKSKDTINSFLLLSSHVFTPTNQNSFIKVTLDCKKGKKPKLSIAHSKYPRSILWMGIDFWHTALKEKPFNLNLYNKFLSLEDFQHNNRYYEFILEPSHLTAHQLLELESLYA